MSKKAVGRVDNADRRSGMERREFNYTLHIPENRTDEDRRCSRDAKNGRPPPRLMERKTGHKRGSRKERSESAGFSENVDVNI